MPIIRREMFDDLTPLRDTMNRLFEESFVWPYLEFGFGRKFPIDIRETEDLKNYVIEASLPGFKPEEVSVSATGDALTITAKHAVEKTGTYMRQERFEGEMNRTFVLPGRFNVDLIEATYEHGVLTLTVPKIEAVKPKQIPIRIKELVSVG